RIRSCASASIRSRPLGLRSSALFDARNEHSGHSDLHQWPQPFRPRAHVADAVGMSLLRAWPNYTGGDRAVSAANASGHDRQRSDFARRPRYQDRARFVCRGSRSKVGRTRPQASKDDSIANLVNETTPARLRSAGNVAGEILNWIAMMGSANRGAPVWSKALPDEGFIYAAWH